MRLKSRLALGHLFAFFLGASSSLGALFGAAYSRLDEMRPKSWTSNWRVSFL